MALSASELRIGNWILDNSNLYSKVIGMKPFDDSIRCDEPEGCEILIDIYLKDTVSKGYVCDSNECSYIALTPEILEKCGFEFNSGFWLISISDTMIRLEFTGLHCQLLNTGGYIGEPFRYIHNLQNLIFTLTQTELKIDL